VRQTTTPSTWSICTPSSFEQQQLRNQIQYLREQEVSDGKAQMAQNGNTDKKTASTTHGNRP